MEDLIWLIPALPLIGFALLLPFGRRLGDPLAGWFATAVVGGSFAASIAAFSELERLPTDDRTLQLTLFEWIPAGGFSVDFGLIADPLSITMCLFITGIATLIHLYSIGYMKGDPDYARFFVYLNLFVASMIFLVMGDNLIMTFLGWEGVGACSYLLISFWFTDRANATAGKKAFVTNRIGDFGFMLGTFLVWVTIGSINYLDITEGAESGLFGAATATAVVLLFFLAAAGKSAQFPLFVWLPDAMAGPTPVSALIHAATMVTSGIFLLTRLNPLLHDAGWANEVIAWVGLGTALIAALAAVAQNDIKKVLAYSTVSQLGYMFLAIGSGAFVAGTFHMVTHAFFKALLFLGSGAVIVSMAHEQDMRRYGQLRKYLPITSATFIVGWLAIAGVPPFSGFWSKDEILAAAYDSGSLGAVKWAIGVAVALLTAFYMTRLVIMTFFGGTENWREPEPALTPEEMHEEYEDAPATAAAIASDTEGDHGDSSHGDGDHGGHHLTPEHEPREPAWTMTVPLLVLAVFATVSGLLNLPFGNSFHVLEDWLDPALSYDHAKLPGLTIVILALVAIAVAFVGIWFAWRVYQRHKVDPSKIEQPAFEEALYIDAAYAEVVGGPGEAAFQGVADFDSEVVDGGVNGVGRLALLSGRAMRGLQSGFVRAYALAIAGGTVALLVFVILRMSS
ncbi:MAG: NADH-quinone oxidoreductase subunit L [Actinomycetia bacterium]|nr:NADH-quinone oxidoreductase subunit L [Actinomycetes bacterium]